MIEVMQSVSPQQPQILETEPRENQWVPPAIILVACIALYFVRLGSFGVLEGGESYYPAAVREMVEAGDMLVPRLNYQLYFSKPILTFWLLGSAYYTCGVPALAGRLWSAVLCKHYRRTAQCSRRCLCWPARQGTGRTEPLYRNGLHCARASW